MDSLCNVFDFSVAKIVELIFNLTQNLFIYSPRYAYTTWLSQFLIEAEKSDALEDAIDLVAMLEQAQAHALGVPDELLECCQVG